MAWTALPDSVVLTLRTPEPRAFTLDATKAALVIVDMQNYFCSDPRSRAALIVEGTARLLTKARDAGIKVIFVQTVREPDAPPLVDGAETHLLAGADETKFVPELAPLEGEIVVQKGGPNPFARTELDAVLLEENILPTDTTIIVAGTWADVSTNAACLGFSNRHYLTLIPMDCQAAATQEDEARTFAKYSENSYAFTLSTMIDFAAVGMTNREMVVAHGR